VVSALLDELEFDRLSIVDEQLEVALSGLSAGGTAVASEGVGGCIDTEGLRLDTGLTLGEAVGAA
jgi:hypothetical protein